MKKILIFLCLFAFASVLFAQTSTEIIQPVKDSTNVDTLDRNLIGLNIFPAFGILGGGRLPSTKIFIQYKHMYDKMNLRASINYLSFYIDNDNVDILGFRSDTTKFEGDSIAVVDKMIFRKFYYDIYSYDVRFGLEAAFPGKGYRFYLGSGLIAGYHYAGEYYYHYEKEFTGYPVQYANIHNVLGETTGYRKTSFLKAGLDFTIGVDINISPNCVVSVQYAPELIYHYKLKQELLDPDSYFTRRLTDGFSFVPDYIDFAVSIRF